MKKIYLTLGAVAVLSCTALFFVQAETRTEIREEAKASKPNNSKPMGKFW